MREPPSIEALRAAALDMSARGLTPRDIGAALHVDPLAVRRLLAADDESAAALHAATWARRNESANPTWR